MKLKLLSPFVYLFLLLSSCNFIDLINEGKPAPPLEKVEFAKENLYPEGVEYNYSKNRFLVSSLTYGVIGEVTLDGHYKEFIKDKSLVSTIGIRIDHLRNRLLVCNSNPGVSVNSMPETQGKLAALEIYNLSTGQKIHHADLGALLPGNAHFANDIALDSAGNAYVTDSFYPVIYKVDKNGKASVLIINEELRAPSGGFGLNGIVYHPNGYLLAAKSDEGILFKIPIDNPTSFSKITLGKDYVGLDGLLLKENNVLAAVVNAAGKVYLLKTQDEWSTAIAIKDFSTGDVFPTTATLKGKNVYVLYAYLNKLFSGAKPPVAKYTIKKAF